MATWPSGTKAGTTNLDAGSDSPRLARPDIKQNVDNVNAIIDMFNIPSSPTNNYILRYNSSTAKFDVEADLAETQSVFSTIAVAGQDSVVADATTDTLTLAAGTGMTITTNATSDTITLASSSSGTITALNNKTANRLTTIGATTTELDGEANATFDGSTLAITGNITASTTIGATTNITAAGSITAGTSIGNDAITIDDHTITATRSNDDLGLEANGTGQVQIRANGGDFANFSTNSKYTGANAMYWEDLALTPGSGTRHERNMIVSNYKLTGSDSANSSDRYRNSLLSVLDLNGVSSTATSSGYRSRGPNAISSEAKVLNTGSSAATLGNAININGGVVIQGGSQDITVTAITGVSSWLEGVGGGAGDITIGDGIGFNSVGWYKDEASGTTALGTFYHYYAQNNQNEPTGKTYSFFSADKTDLMQLSTLESYREQIHALTSSSTIAVDAALAPVHKVTLGVSTQFAIGNLGTGQSITLIITQDGTGSRTASFSESDSTAVKFAGGTPTLSTAANAIDIVTIFNDGTNHLGNVALAFA